MKFLALIFSLMSLAAFAQTRERNIYDLQYLPEKRVIFGTSDVSYSKYVFRRSQQNTKTETSIFSQSFGYSFTDDFSLTISANYLTSTSRSDFDLGTISADTKLNFKGVSDPVIEGKYRLQDNYFRVDLVSGLLVKSGDAELKGDEFNNKIGGHIFNFGLDVGQKFELVQWYLEVLYLHVFETTQVTENETTTDNAFNVYSSTFAVLGFIGEHTLLKGSVRAGVSDPLGGGARSTVQNLTVGPELQHLFTENFLMRMGIAYETRQITSRDGVNEGWLYTLGATYQF